MFLIVKILGVFFFWLMVAFFCAFITEIMVLEGADNDFATYVYYSLAFFTTIGYGDLMPAHDVVRIFRVLYLRLAFFLLRLVHMV